MSVRTSKIGKLDFRCVIRERNGDYFYGNCTDVYMKKITAFLDRYTVDFVPRIGVLGVKVKFNDKTKISNTYTSNSVNIDRISTVNIDRISTANIDRISTANIGNTEIVDELINNFTIVDISVVVKMNRCKIKTGTSTSITFLATSISETNINAIERDLEKMRLM